MTGTRSGKGGGCRGAWVASGAWSASVWAMRRVDLGVSVCVQYCVGVGTQGGVFYTQFVEGVAIGAGLNVGITTREYKDRDCTGYIIGVSTPKGVPSPPVYLQMGAEGSGLFGVNLRDLEVGMSFGTPGFVVGRVTTQDYKFCILSGSQAD